MIMTSTAISTNSHIASLEKTFDQARSPIEWLVIAHRDPRMLRSLSAILEGQSAAILEVSQDEWNWSEGELSSAIEWVLQRKEIRNLVLVGHSQVGGTASRSYLLSADPSQTSDQENNGYVRLLAGVRRVQSQSHHAQMRFAADVQQFLQIPPVYRRWTLGELELHGLFFRAESGLFLTYDPDADTFRATIA
jgi:carbonic anhydrase